MMVGPRPIGDNIASFLLSYNSSPSQATTNFWKFDSSNTHIGIWRNTTELFRIGSTGQVQFFSGFGSLGDAYACRAWVNFNGTGTVAIRGSGNVSSITDGGTGIYTVNFTNAMPDTNFAMVATSGALSPASGFSIAMGNNTYTTSSAQIYTSNNVSGNADQAVVAVAFFR
jgi:hypothetical protein